MDDAKVRESVVGKRIVAALIDIALLAALFFLFAALFGEFGSDPNAPAGSSSFSVSVDGFPSIVMLAIILGYYIGAERMTGATVGKQLLGLRVERVDGQPIGWGAAVGRNLLRLIDGLPMLYLLGIIVVAISRNDQRLGDLAAGTVVVSNRTSVAEPAGD